MVLGNHRTFIRGKEDPGCVNVDLPHPIPTLTQHEFSKVQDVRGDEKFAFLAGCTSRNSLKDENVWIYWRFPKDFLFYRRSRLTLRTPGVRFSANSSSLTRGKRRWNHWSWNQRARSDVDDTRSLLTIDYKAACISGTNPIYRIEDLELMFFLVCSGPRMVIERCYRSLINFDLCGQKLRIETLEEVVRAVTVELITDWVFKI